MAKYKVRQFADAYDIKESTVKSYVHREQLQKDSDGFIDTELDKNKLFIMEMQLKITNGTVKNKEENTEIKKRVAVEKPTGLTAQQKVYSDLDLRTKIATAEAKERENEIKRMQLEKQAGNLLPVDLCEKIITINIQAVFKSFEGEMENMASIYNEEFGGNRTTLVNIVKKQREVFARAIKKASQDAEYELKNAVDEFQETRGRGEKR